MLPLCLFNFYAVYMMQNVGVDKSHSEITRLLWKISKISFIYADVMTLMTESEEELKSLLMRVKEESREASQKVNIQQIKIMASSAI